MLAAAWPGRIAFHDSSRFHHDNLLREERYKTQIMRDIKVGQAVARRSFISRRTICACNGRSSPESASSMMEQLGVGCQGARQRKPLTLSAAETRWPGDASADATSSPTSSTQGRSARALRSASACLWGV